MRIVARLFFGIGAAFQGMVAAANGVALLLGADGFEALNFYRPAFWCLFNLFALWYWLEREKASA